MKKCNALITILLALSVISCGDDSKEKETYFSINEMILKSKYNGTEPVILQINNNKNKTIDSIVYFINNEKLNSVKGNTKFSFDLKGKKLGYQNLKALIFFSGDTISTSHRIELVADKAPALWNYDIVNTYEHDINAFTEGYEFYRDTLIESTGQNGNSYIAKVDYKTGKTIKKVALEQQYFGEGITVLNDKIYQLTWQNAIGFIYDANTMKKIKSFPYDKKVEGWGMTNDGRYIYHSDGTEKIWRMDPETQKLIDYVNVYTNDSKIKSVNELEWIEGKIYGNIWQKDAIAVVNPQTGAVEAVLDLSALRSKVTNPEAEVLNGIAYNKKTKTIFVTGKNWNKTFEIRVKQ
ncbi:glutaminyl-peptide cyclotransferase [Flavobacterium sp.]